MRGLFSLTPKQLFGLDAIGGLMTAAFVGVVLPLGFGGVGLPYWVLGCLSVYGLGCAAFSFLQFSALKHRRESPPAARALLVIAAANGVYVGLITALVMTFDSLTFLGRIYFVGEALVLLVVICFEILCYRHVSRVSE